MVCKLVLLKNVSFLTRFGCSLLVFLLLSKNSSAQQQQYSSIWVPGGGKMTILGYNDPGKTHSVLSDIYGTERNAPYGIVIFPSELLFPNAGDQVHIDGYVRVLGSSLFIFPVGDSGFYGPFSASADGTTGAYFHSNPSQNGLLPTSSKAPQLLGSITKHEYWDVDGKHPTKITLTWDARSQIRSLVPKLSSLTVVGWRNDKWTRISSTVDSISILGEISSFSTGSITTDRRLIPEDYDSYTFGSTELDSADAALHFDLQTEDLYLYPNPATEVVRIKSKSTGMDTNFSTFKITDMNGHDFTSLVAKDQNSLNIGKLNIGMYVVRFFDFYGKAIHSKLIIGQ
jgi:hypothetical protein